mmetsp:Transcript_11556/g.30482  ORF Transcript_11556/g.30482 Transcript_11556/m.30482 type:complete len:543 (+) Transcript_11556:73-1701(+)
MSEQAIPHLALPLPKSAFCPVTCQSRLEKEGFLERIQHDENLEARKGEESDEKSASSIPLDDEEGRFDFYGVQKDSEVEVKKPKSFRLIPDIGHLRRKSQNSYDDDGTTQPDQSGTLFRRGSSLGSGFSSSTRDFPEGYDHATSIKLMSYSTASYCRIHGCQCFSCGCTEAVDPGFEWLKININAEYDAKGMVGISHEQKEIIVAFRGTVSLKNWMSNLDFRRIPIEDCQWMPAGVKAHSGFHKTYRSVSDDIISTARKLHEQYPRYNVFCTGHSLGGALATFAASHLNAMGVKAVGYSYGSPRVGNRKFRDYFNAMLEKTGAYFFRVLNNFDPVPHLPTRSMGFIHVGEEIWFTSTKKTSERKAAVRKNSRITLDIVSLPESKCASDALIASALTIVDHLTYFERLTGLIRLRGQTVPKNPMTADGRIIVVAESFLPIVKAPAKSVFLVMYAPFCQFCMEMSGDFKRLGRHFMDRTDVVIGTFNAVANDVPEGYDMQGYPTLIWVSAKAKAKGDFAPVYYGGKRKFQAMRDFIESALLGDP